MSGFASFLKKHKEGKTKKPAKDFAKKFRQGFNKQSAKEDQKKREDAYLKKLRDKHE